ncbi:uncharacterized protein LOC131158467 [Malania oleifera]|uniref:uncharacterized protein LOC131158467 n=1 Tax=Malania oleifera TaxID=397392 RepID=UPI0025AE7AB7|nr:uncharacterized protein LOC131158467 [Malania oleifera]
MNLEGSSAHASGDDGADPSGAGGGDSDAVLRSVAQHVIAQIAWSSRGQGGIPIDQDCTIEKFIKMNAQTFLGGFDPVVAKNWTQEIEKIGTVLHCMDELRVLYATYKLTKIFFDHYFPATVREAKVIKFVKLTLGSLTAQQYAAKFIELSRFAPYIIPNEVKRVRMFERGLRQDIFKQVAVLKMEDLSELVDRATVAEESEQKDAWTPS